ncbi:lysin B [Mycobacterium phage AN9]|nr:lysin B [Mycobacterium phage ANI8]QJD52569.1 lysin B [Mycobacterium phage AN9]
MSMPWLFTVHGTGQPDPLRPGLPADTARRVLDIYRWQPIGNYPARAFPNMWDSVLAGAAELTLQIEQKLDADPYADFAMAGYSQGAMVVAYVLKHEIMNPQGRLNRFLLRLRKVVFWGNPMRQRGIAHSDEWIHEVAPPESHGIYTDDLLEGLESAPFEVRDYAHRGDMYACNFDTDVDEFKRAICKIVMRANDWFVGEDSVWSQLMELKKRPLFEMFAMAKAIVQAIKFFAGSAHDYNIEPAVRFLRS